MRTSELQSNIKGVQLAQESLIEDSQTISRQRSVTL